MDVADDDSAERNAELEALYARRYTSFLRVAIALLGDLEQARDAVQEAFARALRGLPGFRSEAPLEAWVFSILTNHCRDLRRVERELPGEVEAEAVGNGQPGEHADVRAAVALLPERQCLVLFLRHYADMDYESIAAALQIERGTVAATLHAAHARLRGILEGATR